MTPYRGPLCTIGYVEDVQAEAEDFVKRCEDIGIANPVTVFSSGEELEKRWPDNLGVLLVDLVLLSTGHRQRQGWDVIEWVRERDDQIPIIVVTKTDDDLVEAMAARVGANALVTKPINMEELERKMNEAGMSMGLYRRPRPEERHAIDS